MIWPAVVEPNVAPTPSVAPSLDPFAPDPTMWPEAPDWLFPLTMVLLGLAIIVVVTLLSMWWRALRYEKLAAKEREQQDWVDLSSLTRKGTWRDQPDAPPTDLSDGTEVAESDNSSATNAGFPQESGHVEQSTEDK